MNGNNVRCSVVINYVFEFFFFYVTHTVNMYFSILCFHQVSLSFLFVFLLMFKKKKNMYITMEKENICTVK